MSIVGSISWLLGFGGQRGVVFCLNTYYEWGQTACILPSSSNLAATSLMYLLMTIGAYGYGCRKDENWKGRPWEALGRFFYVYMRIILCIRSLAFFLLHPILLPPLSCISLSPFVTTGIDVGRMRIEREGLERLSGGFFMCRGSNSLPNSLNCAIDFEGFCNHTCSRVSNLVVTKSAWTVG